MEYLSIPDDFTGKSFNKIFKKFKYDLLNNSNTRRKFSIGFIITFIFWFIIRTFFKWDDSFTSLSILEKDKQLLSPKFTTFNMKNYFDPLINKYNKLPSDASLRAQLAFYFPYDENNVIPNNIFQTWKVPIDDPSFPKHFSRPFESWSSKNENFTHTLIPDSIIDEWVLQEFSNVPAIIETWNLLPKFILKADFFRYLVIFSRGGIYSDMDTICLKPIKDWAIFNEEFLPEGISDHSIGCAVGIEADPDRPDWSEWYARRIQFVQWTVVGKRGHPFLREIITRIVEETFRKKRLGKLKTVEGKDAGGDVMQWTGPGIFTDTLFDYLNNVYSNGEYGDGYGIGSKYWNDGKKYKLKKQELDSDGMPLHKLEMPINWLNFTRLQEPMTIDDIMILPITSFSPDVGQMGSKSRKDPLAFVKHTFEGSWKPEDERM